MVIAMRNPALPQVRAFAPSSDGVRELAILREPPNEQPLEPAAPIPTLARDAAIRQARDILRLDRNGRPQCKDSRRIFLAIEALRQAGAPEIDDLLVHGFLQGAPERHHQYVAGHLRSLDGSRFTAGTPCTQARHFCGETPEHPVLLSPFRIAGVPVTNELFSLYDDRRREGPAGELDKPAVDVSWFDAAIFALWVGCRLPTEAEWEFACGAGSPGEWCCPDDAGLTRHAWYSENSEGRCRPVGTREPNAFGLFDTHGNVWEWCRDCYDQDFYARAPLRDPVNAVGTAHHKVCRGGSFQALSEMCRTRYRFHEPPHFTAGDLGFRLAACVDGPLGCQSVCER
jgi:hypothetical protein